MYLQRQLSTHYLTLKMCCAKVMNVKQSNMKNNTFVLI